MTSEEIDPYSLSIFKFLGAFHVTKWISVCNLSRKYGLSKFIVECINTFVPGLIHSVDDVVLIIKGNGHCLPECGLTFYSN